jgi:hypothetical protein
MCFYMARGGLSFERIGAKYVTVQAAGSVSAVALASGAAFVEGKAVTCEGNGLFGFGQAGDALRGIIDKYEDDHYMTIQFAGFREGVPGISGALPAANDYLVVNGSGAVSEVATAVNGAYAVEVDDTADVNAVTVFIG